MNKHKLLESVIERLEQDRLELKDAAQATYDAATNEESKPENEYDTRALEASYLAGAQAQRIVEIEDSLVVLRMLKVREFPDGTPITLSALIEVEYLNKKSLLFMLPKAGGTTVQFDGRSIQVITPTSLLGEALTGLEEGDTAVMEAGRETKEYDILKVV